MLQAKIVPFDSLQVEMAEHVLSRHFNAADRTRQDLIVCASLVDKPTNLGGLARTCEIFAAKSMTLPNEKIKQHEMFKSLAVSADQWMPLEEVKVPDLLSWLRCKRAEGYSIVALEQSTDSHSLASPVLARQLPPKVPLSSFLSSLPLPPSIPPELPHQLAHLIAYLPTYLPTRLHGHHHCTISACFCLEKKRRESLCSISKKSICAWKSRSSGSFVRSTFTCLRRLPSGR